MMHRKKGTPWAVRRLLADLGFQAEYSEWWQFGGVPFVDRLKVWVDDYFDLSRESRNLIMLAWNLTKAARTHLEYLSLGLWFEDLCGPVHDGLSVNARLPFFDLYPWPGLRYGGFWYGGMICYGDFDYGGETRYGGGSEGAKTPPVFEPVRYGEFRYDGGTKYGDGTVVEGEWHKTHCYGEDEPDLLSDFAGTLAALIDEHATPSIYGETRYGGFVYGAGYGAQDGGGDITVRRPLFYGKFGYGDGIPRYGMEMYGGFAYGGSPVRYGGDVLKEAI
jgi:hypothetical protein